MKFTILYLIAAALIPAGIAAQTTEQTKQPNFYEIQRSAEEYWRGRVAPLEAREDGKIEGGYNQYKRWEWFWEDRVYPTGEFPQPDILFRESRKLAARQQRKSGESPLQTTVKPEWRELGPTAPPIGPHNGIGRLNSVHLIPDFPTIIWAGSAGGGAWKSTDAGATWRSTTDRLPTLGVSDIATAPGNPNIVYLATGDCFGPGGYDQPIAYSAGVIKSTDGGETWQQTGLQYQISNARRIFRLLQHPELANVLLAATDNGIFKTTDAGATWAQKTTGNFRDMELKPEDPTVAYASTTNSVQRSTDGGETWRTLTTSIPNSIGRIAIAVTYAHPEYIYALTTRGGAWDFGGFYRSTDGGDTWTRTATTPNIIGRDLDGQDTDNQQGWYDLCVAASHSRANTVYVGGINIWKSTNGGTTWTIASHWFGQAGTPYVHADIHGLTAGYDTDEMYAATDGGVYRSINQKTWINLSNGKGIMQFYRIACSQQDPGIMLGGAQDNGTSLLKGGRWEEASGGDGMNCLIDYTNHTNMFASSQNGAIRRSVDGGQNFAGTINETTTGEDGGWVTPYVFHPTNPKILFAGFRQVWKTTNGGVQWSRLGSLPNASGTLSYIAVSPSDPNVIYAGNSGRLYKTTDGGGAWTLAKSPAGGAIRDVVFHPQNSDKVWVAFSGFSQQKVFETTDGGGTWRDISAGLPAVPVNCMIYQNNSPDRLYVGTDLGVFTRDTIANVWVSYNDGLPNVIVSDLVIYEAGKKLRAGTFGRGIWEGNLSDCNTPLPVNVTASGTTNFCEGDSVVLQADGNYPEYRWTNGQTGKTLVVRKSGSYQVFVTDASGCQGGSQPVTVAVSVIRAPSITANRPFGLCPQDSIQLDAGLGFARYRWSTGDTTRRIVVKTAGIYSVTVANNDGCEATGTPVELKEFPPVIRAALFKNRDTLGTIGAKAYQWFKNNQPVSGATRQSIVFTANDIGAVFKVKITDDNGCTTMSDEFTVQAVSVAESPAGAWAISPNPSGGAITLNGTLPIGGTMTVEITDAAGKTVASIRFDAAAGALTRTLDFSGLPAGGYLLHIATPDGAKHLLKLIRQ